ncbi:MAG: HEAT repeat domain-containing protein [Candidatus Geothermincolia bacterium]
MNISDDRRYEALSGDLKSAIERHDTRYLLEALEDASFNVRVAAVEGLGELGGEQARMALVRIARDRWGQRPELRIAALRTLGRVSEPARYVSLLEEFIDGDNRKVVKASREILRDLDPVGFPGRLVARGCIDHGAIRVYGVSREPSALPLLAGFLDERMTASDISSTRYWGKAYAAVRALGNIGGPGSVETLEKLKAWLAEAPQAETAGFPGQRLGKIEEEAGRALETARSGGPGA